MKDRSFLEQNASGELTNRSRAMWRNFFALFLFMLPAACCMLQTSKRAMCRLLASLAIHTRLKLLSITLYSASTEQAALQCEVSKFRLMTVHKVLWWDCRGTILVDWIFCGYIPLLNQVIHHSLLYLYDYRSRLTIAECTSIMFMITYGPI